MGEEKNVFKAVILFIVGLIGAVIGFIVAGLLSKPNNRAKIKDSGTSFEGLPNSLRDNGQQIKDVRSDIRESRDTIEQSIERLKDTLRIIDSTENGDGDLQKH